VNKQITEFLTQQLSDRVSALPSRTFCPEDWLPLEIRRWDYAVAVPPYHCIVAVENRQKDGSTFFSASVMSVELQSDTIAWGQDRFATPEEALQEGFAMLLSTVEDMEEDQKNFQAAEAEKRSLEIAGPLE
jgi:hypothetical protein